MVVGIEIGTHWLLNQHADYYSRLCLVVSL